MKTNIREPRLRGTRSLAAILPNGAVVWLNLQPAPVPIRELDRIAETIDFESLRRSQMLGVTDAEAKELARELHRNTTRLCRLRLREDRKLLDRISAGDAKLDRRVDASLMPVIRKIKTDRKKQEALLRKRERSELWNQLVLVSAALLMAAYGQRGHPLSENNLVISLSLGVWLFGDEIADRLSGKRARGKNTIKGLDVWSYTAPFGNLLTGWWLLSGHQQERFITGLSDFKNLKPKTIGCKSAVCSLEDLSSRIAPDHLQEFQAFRHVPVVATIQSVKFADDSADSAFVSLLEAKVIFGYLWIIVEVPHNRPELKELQVAWIVDTRKPVATPLPKTGKS